MSCEHQEANALLERRSKQLEVLRETGRRDIEAALSGRERAAAEADAR